MIATGHCASEQLGVALLHVKQVLNPATLQIYLLKTQISDLLMENRGVHIRLLMVIPELMDQTGNLHTIMIMEIMETPKITHMILMVDIIMIGITVLEVLPIALVGNLLLDLH